MNTNWSWQWCRQHIRVLSYVLLICSSSSYDPSRTSRRFRSSRSCAMRRKWLLCSSWWSPASWFVGHPTLLCPWWRPSAARVWSLPPWPLSPHSLPSPAQPTTLSSMPLWAERLVIGWHCSQRIVLMMKLVQPSFIKFWLVSSHVQ